mgnify:CR=1 FL=1
MTDNEIIKVGDICLYFYDNDNKSISIVEVVKYLSTDVLVVKFLQVVVDDSGNGLFDYLYRAEKTMNVSRKYLHKIDLITCQREEIEGLKKILAEEEEKYKLCAKRFYKVGVKDFAEKLKSTYFIDSERLCCQVDKVFKEMAGDTE